MNVSDAKLQDVTKATNIRREPARHTPVENLPKIFEGDSSSIYQVSGDSGFFEGLLEPLDGKARISPAIGPSKVVTFGADKAENMYEAMHKPVRVKVDPKTHKVKDIEVTQPQLFSDTDTGFFAPPTIDQLIAEQNVQAVADPAVFGSLSDDDVDALIAEIHQGRQA